MKLKCRRRLWSTKKNGASSNMPPTKSVCRKANVSSAVNSLFEQQRHTKNAWSCRVGICLRKFTWQLITSGKHSWEGPVIIRLQLVFGCFCGTHFRSLTNSTKRYEHVGFFPMFSLRPFCSMVDCRPTKEREKARDSAHYERESMRSERHDTLDQQGKKLSRSLFPHEKTNFYSSLSSVSPSVSSLSLHLSLRPLLSSQSSLSLCPSGCRIQTVLPCSGG